MSKKHNKYGSSTAVRWSFKEWLGLLIITLVIGSFLKTCFHNIRRNNALADKTLQCKAVVIDNKNFFGNSPVSREFSYSYRFEIDNKFYEGDTGDSDYQVGDSIVIEYVSSNPVYNRPATADK